MDIVTYALAKKFALKVAAGFSSVSVDEATSTINFILNDGTAVSLKIPQLRSIKDIYLKDEINPTTSENEKHLICELTDDTLVDAGVIPDPEVKISKAAHNKLKKLDDGIYVGEEIIKLTKAEFDALPEAERKRTDVVYFVTDEGGEPETIGTLTEDLTATVAIGSVTVGKKYVAGTSLETIIRDILIKEVGPSGTLSHIPTDKLYDIINDTVEDLTLKIIAVKGTYDIAKIEFYVNNAVVKTLDTAADIKDGGTFNYAYHFDTPTNDNISLKVVITDTKGTKASPNTVIKFVGKSYFGYVPESVVTPSETDIKGLQNNTLKDKSALTYADIPLPQDGNLYKVLYGYPKEFGKVNKIVDADGRDYTASYTQSELQVDGIDYYAYILTDGTGAAGATQKFS